MKALIFAAGLGTRLKPLTDNKPKALVPILGKPMIEYQILKLKRAGFNQIVINIHHFGQQIIDFLKQNNNFGIEINISDERDFLLDTGGGIMHAQQFLQGSEPFLVHNVDIFSDVDLNALYTQHCQTKAFATLLVSNRKSSRHFLFDSNNQLCGWKNNKTNEFKWAANDTAKDNLTELAFGGIHVISPEIFKNFDGWNGKFSIVDYYISQAGTHKILAFVPQKLNLIDVGKPETLSQMEGEYKNLLA